MSSSLQHALARLVVWLRCCAYVMCDGHGKIKCSAAEAPRMHLELVRNAYLTTLFL